MSAARSRQPPPPFLSPPPEINGQDTDRDRQARTHYGQRRTHANETTQSLSTLNRRPAAIATTAWLGLRPRRIFLRLADAQPTVEVAAVPRPQRNGWILSFGLFITSPRLGSRSARRVRATPCGPFGVRAMRSGNQTPSALGHLPMGREPPQGAVIPGAAGNRSDNKSRRVNRPDGNENPLRASRAEGCKRHKIWRTDFSMRHSPNAAILLAPPQFHLGTKTQHEVFQYFLTLISSQTCIQADVPRGQNNHAA